MTADAPRIWFQVGLHCTCGIEVSGFSFSGVPGVVIGRNNRIAWGFTILGPDVTDLYLERMDGDRVQVDAGWRDLEKRQETIKIAGADPVTIMVRTGRNGPLLCDASPELKAVGGQYAVALRWTALDPGARSTPCSPWTRRGTGTSSGRRRRCSRCPRRTWSTPTWRGNIGYQAPGRIPVRGKGDGKWPAPGWDSAYQWRSYLQFAELPSVLNPAQGYVVTANQAAVGPTYPRFLTDDWSYGYRAERINQMINDPGRGITAADIERMPFDNRNGLAPSLVPALLRAQMSPVRRHRRRTCCGAGTSSGHSPRRSRRRQPADGPAGSPHARGSAAAAYFNAVWRSLLVRIFDELPAGHKPDGGDRWWEVVRGLLDNPSSPWWDDRGTPAIETADQIIAAAMQDAAR